ncbi:hypothetical protein MSAS_53430 [Mycobacterium saskatchewanense]|uniref:Enoyl reductase (ER) domain-containing protein n=1 Tax=Mycobacterium saskatchewanense TaxID=220927 RepID=A0AAJ3NQ95_9MYCO|nr:zinc-binding dehydrogenase [Mycobacterium saskatchewanense]ORW70977.1 hypothetical protein AWC23_15115 [Mycobacterium saskatchewanense]BBX66169.1 hypothetical protein MSAS_53430 [Mycobacterium saskatchewanense]
MTALRAHHRGGPRELVVEPAPVPVPAPGEVLVAVHAAAITFDELTWEETWTRDGASRTPVIPSHEVSGVVHQIGTGVTDFAPGDEVYGLIPFDRDGAAAAASAPRPAGRADEYGVTATFFIVPPDRDQLTRLAALVDDGRLRVQIAATFPLGEGREAFESGQRPGRRPGKTVIVLE